MKALIFLIIAVVTPTLAHDAPIDGFGCHNAKGGTYHCHSGPLAGRAFVNKAAAVAAMVALEKVTEQEEKEAAAKAASLAKPSESASSKPAPVPPVAPPPLKLSDHEPIKVISWSASQLGKDNLDFKHIAPLIAIADLVILEDLSLTDLSRNGVNALAEALSVSVKEKICRAMVLPAKGAKGRGAFIWKDRKLGFVRGNGMFRENCDIGEFKVTDRRAMAQFYVKHAKQFINVTSLSRESELAPVFAAQTQFPSIIAGDTGVPLADSKLNIARENRFSPVFLNAQTNMKSFTRDFKPSQDQIFYRGLGAFESRVIDLYAEYPDLDVDQIRMKFSDHLPLYTEFKFPFDDEQPNPPAASQASENEQ